MRTETKIEKEVDKLCLLVPNGNELDRGQIRLALIEVAEISKKNAFKKAVKEFGYYGNADECIKLTDLIKICNYNSC